MTRFLVAVNVTKWAKGTRSFTYYSGHRSMSAAQNAAVREVTKLLRSQGRTWDVISTSIKKEYNARIQPAFDQRLQEA